MLFEDVGAWLEDGWVFRLCGAVMYEVNIRVGEIYTYKLRRSFLECYCIKNI